MQPWAPEYLLEEVGKAVQDTVPETSPTGKNMRHVEQGVELG